MKDLIQRLRNPLSSVPKKECADALEKQQAEIEGWKEDQKENLRNQCDLQAEINTLKAQAANDAADAGRYWWLASEKSETVTVAFDQDPNLDDTWTKVELDAAIDAAMKEPTMKHPHAEILKAFIEDTNVHIEEEYKPGDWRPCGIGFLVSCPSGNFRIKPAMRSITLADGTVVSWPEPMRVAPENGTQVWYINGGGIVDAVFCSESVFFSKAIPAGFCHATEEAAQQHRKALVLANGGEL